MGKRGGVSAAGPMGIDIETPRVGVVNFASSIDGILGSCHAFNEPHSPMSGGEPQNRRAADIQPTGWWHGASTHIEREQYRNMTHRKGFEEEE